MKQVWPHVEHRPHEQPARAPTHRVDALFVCVAALNEVFGTGKKIGKGIFLVQQFSGLIPFTAQLFSPSNVRNGKHESAIQQA